MKLFHYAAPQNFYRLAGQLWPWCACAASVLAALGLWWGLWLAPTDAQQGQAYRIIYLHVPVSWMAMVIYLAMAFWSVMTLVFQTRLSALLTRALAPTGALMALLSLWTGALWGKPMWGTYWVWDARLTSMLILLFLYLGYMALTSAIDEPRRSDRAGALVALVGAVNVPIIYFSVKWWNTLHQGASVSLTQSPKMASVMLTGMLLMTLAFWLYALAMVLWRVRSSILLRESHASWVQHLPEVAARLALKAAS